MLYYAICKQIMFALICSTKCIYFCWDIFQGAVLKTCGNTWLRGNTQLLFSILLYFCGQNIVLSTTFISKAIILSNFRNKWWISIINNLPPTGLYFTISTKTINTFLRFLLMLLILWYLLRPFVFLSLIMFVHVIVYIDNVALVSRMFFIFLLPAISVTTRFRNIIRRD